MNHDQETVIWDALTADPAIGVAIITLDGTIEYANDRIGSMFLGARGADIVGKNLYELYPREWADERVAVFHRILESGRPAIMRHIRRGRQLQSTITRLEQVEGREQPRFLTITHEGEHEQPGEAERFEVVESLIVDLGALSVLSKRELEVLAMMKQGLSREEIGRIMYISEHTVSKYRQSIGRKLGIAARDDLVRLAQQAGLEFKDAHLKRAGADPGARK